MTRLHKELDSFLDSLMFPTRASTTFNNTGASYPPYNIVKLSDTETVLEIAVAGFKEDEISVVIEDNTLKISGRKDIDSESSSTYLHKGIASRSFEKSFSLPKDVIIESGEYTDGILSIFVRYEIPEEKKPKQIPIYRGGRSFLSE